jgi:hypothetical protein
MNQCKTLTPSALKNLLLNMAVHAPVFIWGPPGIGKSSIVRSFADELGYECVTLIGQQLLPEDLLGVPKIVGDVSVFCPPSYIVRDKPFVLFLDELNAASPEIQKAFMSLILDKRVGNYTLPAGSIIIGAGNRAEDSALVKNLPSPLINRMLHVQMEPSPEEWLTWASQEALHPLVINYLTQKPEHLISPVPKAQQPFSTPRSWSMLGAAMKDFNPLDARSIEILAYGLLSASHASTFVGFCRLTENQFMLNEILAGTKQWPANPKDRDLLYFLAQAFRSQLLKTLPAAKGESPEQKQFVHTSKGLIASLATISSEMAKVVLTADEQGRSIPDWYALEIVRDMPTLAAK